MILDCFRWGHCPEQTQVQVHRLVAEFRRQLSENLVGVYLHGSLATGCFNPAHSDVDLLVVIRQRLSAGAKRRLIEALLRLSNAPHPVEVSFLRRDDLHPWQYPTPFALHYSEDWRERFVGDLAADRWRHWFEEATDNDLAAHVAVTKARGVCLWGAAIDLVFPNVPRQDLADSIASDLAWARERLDRHPVYGVLNACRIHAYRQEGLLLSKAEGAEWARQKMPDRFQAVIDRALAAYRSAEGEVAFSGGEEARRLVDYVAQRDSVPLAAQRTADWRD